MSAAMRLDHGSSSTASPPLSPAGNVICRQCGKSYSRPENLARHSRAAHGKSAQLGCKFCAKRFTRSDLLKKHLKIHQRDSSEQEMSDQPAPSNPDIQLAPPPSNFAGPDPLTASTYSSDDLNLLNSGAAYGEGLYDSDLAWTFDFMAEVSNPQEATLEYNLNQRSDDLQISGMQVAYEEHPTQMDWPDKDSRPASPGQRQRRPKFFDAKFVDENELVSSFNQLNHDLRIDVTVAQEICLGLYQVISSDDLLPFCGPAPSQRHFPSTVILQHFLYLYFLHVHPQFPLIHEATFSPSKTPPLLLLSMAILGSCHARSNHGKFCNSYLERIRMIATLEREKDSTYIYSTDNIIVILLLSIAALWSGRSDAYRLAEIDRGVLVVACRRRRLLDCRIRSNDNQDSNSQRGDAKLNQIWLNWITRERDKRLGLCTYLFDCQFAALCQRQPFISKTETINAALPCPSTYWEAPNSQAWKLLLGPADIPPSIYFLPTLNTILLHREVSQTTTFPQLDGFSRILLIYVLHVQIFEFRQVLSMINLTGLVTSPLSFAPQQLNDASVARHRWLQIALNDWASQYGTKDSQIVRSSVHSSCGLLLYHLGHLALSLNFSDLHVMAGRTGLEEDILLAEESLCNWLGKDNTHHILDHTFRMLKVAHDFISMEKAPQYLFEAAVCFFTSGLVCWAICHLSKEEIAASAILVRRHHLEEQGQHDLPRRTPEGMDSRRLLMQYVQEATAALRSLSCPGFASTFACILTQLAAQLG